MEDLICTWCGRSKTQAIKVGFFRYVCICGNDNFKPRLESGWLTKAIIAKFKERKFKKKKDEIENLKLDLEKAKINKEIEKVRGSKS